jgi:spermidine/putrescine transport system ATP-binding protein
VSVVSGTPAAIDVQQVVKVFGSAEAQVRALRSITLDIRDNEFFTLLGPSGCGKTTLLRLIAGFDAVTDGEIRLYGEEIEHLPPNKRPVNTIFQHYALFPHLSVSENVAYGLKRLGQSDAQVRATTEEMLALVKMEEFGSRRPNQLSGGQQQRVALARALAPHPKVLLLDEPLSALDLKLRQAMRGELKRLQRDTGITFVFVTHDQEEALTMSDRIAVMSEGELQQIGSPEEIYQRPVNRFVADFVGAANLIPARCVSRAGDTAVCTWLDNDTVDALADDSCVEGADVALFVRPERVTLVADEGPGHGQIIDVTYLGSTTLFEVRLHDGTVVRASRPADETTAATRGAQVLLHISPGQMRVLSS